MSSLPAVAIIGAGLSGLSLGLCLKHKGIATVIYDRATSSPRYNYGISLRSSTYRPLLGMLHMEEATFREELAVDSQQGGVGTLSGTDNPLQVDAFYCHRGRLEALLGKELSISWDKRLKSIELNPYSKEITTLFEDGFSLKTTYLIGCDGPHSMTRQSQNPTRNLEVLPYVVFNGKRQISSYDYMEYIHTHMNGSVIIQAHKGDTRLEISINNFDTAYIHLSYTYSRPAHGSSDPLHKPDRPISGATEIPEEFYEEVAALQDLEPVFKYIFDAEKIRDDRVLHWLMRSLTPEPSEAVRLAQHGVVLIGDAVHATPIIGGDGANIAIKDSIDLAEHIAAHGLDDFSKFSEAKFGSWIESVSDSKKRIKKMHSPSMSSL